MPTDPHDDAAWQADLFRALGEPNRLRIVFRLLDGPCAVGGLALALGAEQSLVSHHLAALRRSGLVAAERSGRLARYALKDRVRGALEGPSLDLGCCVVTFGVFNPNFSSSCKENRREPFLDLR